MEKIKDFIYRQNDLVIVLIILAAAAFIIYSRVTLIMDYPQQFASDSAVVEQTVPDDQAQQAAPAGSDDANANGEAAGSDDANANGEPAENAQ